MKIKVKKTLILICYIRKMKKQFSILGDPTIEQRNEDKINSNDLSRRIHNALSSLVNPAAT